jgi:WD40 repeat protein
MKQFSWMSYCAIGAGLALVSGAAAAATASEPVVVFQGHKEPLNSLAFSPDGKTLASGSSDKTVKLWSVASGKERATLVGHQDGVSTVAYVPHGTMLVSASADKTIKLWDGTTGKELGTLRGHQHGISRLAFTPDGKILASVGVDDQGASEFKFWDWNGPTSKVQSEMQVKGQVNALSFSPDNRTLAYVSQGVRLYDVVARKELPPPAVSEYGAVCSLVLSPDGKTLAYSGGFKNRPAMIHLWDLAIGKNRADLGGVLGVGFVAYTPDGKTIATWTQGSSKTAQIKLWDAITVKERGSIDTKFIRTVAFSLDGMQLAVAEWESGIRVWQIENDAKN